MKRLYTAILCALFSLVFIACSDDDSFSTSPSNILTFETDTLSLDTVFSTVPSPHKQMFVYNTSGDGIRITNVRLQNGNQTGFRVNVNGTYLGELSGYKVNDLELREGDSLRIFVELTSANNLDTKPQPVSDNLIFTLESGVRQQINLKALSWDAFLLRNLTINNDTTISNPDGKPVVVYGNITVKEGKTLTIAPGTTIYFHDKAGIDVSGTLKAIGEQDNEITLRCDRLDRMVSNLTYDNNPGQWGGITLRANSFNNEMAYTDLHGATSAFLCDSSVNATDTKLILRNTTIHNLKGHGVKATNCKIHIENTQISNALDSCLYFLGGDVNIQYSTIAQYYAFPSNRSRGPALAFANALGDQYIPLTMTVSNSIVKGYDDDVIYWSRGSLDNELQVKFENCLLRTPQPSTSDITMFSDCIFEDVKDTLTTGPNSFIMFDTHNFFYDFTPKEGSQAIGAAIPDPNIPIDRKGKTRHTQKPDMGCYETDKE